MKKHDYHIIDNTFVYGLDESIVASGYPMSDKLIHVVWKPVGLLMVI